MAEKNSAVQELLEEVRAIRDAVEVIEKRSIYLKPDSIVMSASKQVLAGLLRGVGLFIGAGMILAVLGFVAKNALQSGIMQNYISDQIQQSVDNSIKNLPKNFNPFQ